jgi:hypothetical protein
LTIPQIRTIFPPSRAARGAYHDRHDTLARVAMGRSGVR